MEEPPRRSGFSVWLAAATTLVIGIGIGFASGYRIGKGQAVVAPSEKPAAATSGATGGQPFSESSVSEPINLNPPPIIPAPEKSAGPPNEASAGPRRGPDRAAGPAPQPQPGKTPGAVGRVPPRTQAVAADPPAPPSPIPTGPGSLQVVSRPAGAQVIVDGKNIGKTPLTISEVAVGFHNIQLELTGFKGWSTTVGVKPGASTRVAASLEQ